MITAAEEDNVGKYAKGAMDRLLKGSRDALAAIEDAGSRCAREDVFFFCEHLLLHINNIPLC